MAQETSKTRFWAIVALANAAALGYPIKLCIQSDGRHALLLATLLVWVSLVMAVADVAGGIIAYRK